MKNNFFSCPAINNLTLSFRGRVDTNRKMLGFCRENIEKTPSLPLCETPDETIKQFYKLWETIIFEGKKALNDPERVFTKVCLKCVKYKTMPLPKDNLVHDIKICTFPALCQCKCVYCNDSENDLIDTSIFIKESVINGYEKVFNTIEYAHKSGMIAQDAVWHIVVGEIALHPYKNRIFNLINDKASRFFSNCFIFDQHISDNLSANPKSSIYFSIDAGTQETWYKVKGVNNFEHVIDNLKKYRKAGRNAEQILLKYIVLPGINDSQEDFIAIVDIMKMLNIRNLEISRDYSSGRYRTYNTTLGKEEQDLIHAVAHLITNLYKNNLTMKLHASFSPEERDKIQTLVNIIINEID